MATFYVKSGAGAADYNAAHAYSLHDKMVPSNADVTSNVAASRKWVWECTTAGTTNGAITWSAAPTQDSTTITQNGVVFTARKPGFSSGTTADWTFATIYLAYAMSCLAAAGDIVYVSNNHAESQGAAIALAGLAATSVLCVNDSAAPPTAVTTGASVTTTGAFGITPSPNGMYWYGVTFNIGTGNVTALFSGQSVVNIWERCTFILVNTGAASVIRLGGKAINCDFKFANSAQLINIVPQMVGGSLLAGGTSPATIFAQGVVSWSQDGGYAIRVEDFDLSNASSSINLTSSSTDGMTMLLRNCKMPASWSGSVNGSTPGHLANVTLMNSDAAGTNYMLQSKQQRGSINQETTIVRSGGARDGVTSLSWKFVTLSGAFFPANYIVGPEIVIWNQVVGSPITLVVECVNDGATLTNAQLWLEASYLGASGSPLGTFTTAAAASVLATPANLTTSTATWTTTGLASPVKQSMSLTFTPQLKGFIHVLVKLAKASQTVYVDPVLTISGQASGAQYQIPGGMFVNAPAGFPASRVFTEI